MVVYSSGGSSGGSSGSSGGSSGSNRRQRQCDCGKSRSRRSIKSSS